MENAKFSEHELVEQPICILSLITTEEEEPLRLVEMMRKRDKMPAQYQNEIYST